MQLESGINKELKILIVSSLSPYQSADLGKDIIDSLLKRGHNVDFITRYKFDKMLSNMYSVYSEYEPPTPMSFATKIKNRFPFLKKIHKPSFLRDKSNYYNGITIVNKDESIPPVDSALILNKIRKDYDLIIVLFWQFMITTQSLQSIYEKLKVPVFIIAVDMFPMTGGCHYFRNCRRFTDSCGLCPAFNSTDENDITHFNFQYKKKVYSSIEYVLLGNKWISHYASMSPLFNKSLIKHLILPTNEETFNIKDNERTRKELNIDITKKFLIFAGAPDLNRERKGFKYLIESVNLFLDKLSIREKQEVLIILAGKVITGIDNIFHADVVQLGFLGIDRLSEVYSVSDVFLCPSIDDAGPTMINQSIMCGTPVVSFEMGVAFDLIENNITGYRAKMKDSNDFSNGIKAIYDLDTEEKMIMQKNCRNLAVKNYSRSVFSEKIENIFAEISISKRCARS